MERVGENRRNYALLEHRKPEHGRPKH
jgi:hypothetical protein